MITRYTVKKWWSMKEDSEGQYVAYPEHQEAMDALLYENAKLWERIAQQTKEYKELEADRKEWIERHGVLWAKKYDLTEDYLQETENLKLHRAILIALLFTYMGMAGVYLWG